MNRDKLLNLLNSKIARNLVLLVVLFIIIPLLFVGIFPLTQYYRDQKEFIIQNQYETLEKISMDILSHLEQIETEMKSLSYRIDFNDKKKTKYFLNTFINDHVNYDKITVTDIAGMEVFKVSRYYSFTEDELENISSNQNYRYASKGSFYISPLQPSEHTGLPMLTLSVPIYNLTGRVIGVMLLDIKVKKLWNSMYNPNKDSYAYIINQNGTLISNKDLSPVLSKKNLRHVKLVHSFLRKGEKSAEYNGLESEKVIGTYKPIPLLGWAVIIEQPIRLAYKNIYQIMLLIIFIIGIMIFLAAGSTLYFSYTKLILPITLLKEGLKELSKGNINAQVEIKSNDELGSLAESFNKMALDLKMFKLELEKKNRDQNKMIKEKTDELTNKIIELEATKSAVLNILEDVDNTNKTLLATQAKLKEYVNELKLLDKKKDEFISISAHELKTPLASIQGFVELLQNDKISRDPLKSKKYFGIIKQDTKRLARLITDILDLSRLDLGTMKFQFEKLNIKEFMKDVRNQNKVIIKGKGVNCRFTSEKDLPLIFTDRSRIMQVISNLILNAVHYTQKGGKITVSAGRKGKNIIFSVKDTGVGIPIKYQKRIFDRFFQVDSSYTRKIGGTGLGLAICKGIIKALGGKLWVTSADGKGSEFCFSLPIEQSKKGHHFENLFGSGV